MSKVKYTEQEAIDLITEKFKEITEIMWQTEIPVNSNIDNDDHNPFNYITGYILGEHISI